jgi:hypothetical protein
VKLAEVVEKLGLSVRTATGQLDTDVTGGYASDLMSDVIANGRKGDVWVTLQVHHNIAAVASMNDLAGVILVNGREPEEQTIVTAVAEDIPIMVSTLPAFELIGRLYNLGISGAPGRDTAQRASAL